MTISAVFPSKFYRGYADNLQVLLPFSGDYNWILSIYYISIAFIVHLLHLSIIKSFSDILLKDKIKSAALLMYSSIFLCAVRV